MFYVYLLKSRKDKSLYVGYTEDLRRRLNEHNKGKNKSTKYKIPYDLVYYEAYKSQADAKYREKNLKYHANAYTQLKNRTEDSLR